MGTIHSITLKEYLNHLNIGLGCCSEFHSCYTSSMQAEQITADDYERLDPLHFKAENALLKLMESVQKKQTDKNIHGKIVAIDPKSLNPDTEVMRF